jgi:hypothetical protein
VTTERRATRILEGVDEPRTADAACLVRLWMEGGDTVLRGRVESTIDDTSTTAQGIDGLTTAVAAELARIERALVGTD